MDVIFTILLQIWLWLKYVPVPYKIMGYHTRNVYYDIVRNARVLVYLVKRQIEMQKTRVQKYILMLTAKYHIVLFMAYSHMNNGQYFLYVTLILVL